MVEQRSPKPRAEGSSPSAPAKTKNHPLGWFFVFVTEIEPEVRGACRVALPSAAGGGYSEAKASAAVEIRRATAKTANFGHRKRAISSPSAPANKKVSFVYRTKETFLRDAFLSEHDAHFVRDAGFARDARLQRVRNASHHLSLRSGITYHLFSNRLDVKYACSGRNSPSDSEMANFGHRKRASSSPSAHSQVR